MPPATEPFDVQAAFEAVGGAMMIIVSHVGFLVAVHGLALGAIIGLYGFFLSKRGRPSGKPLVAVFRKLFIFCGILAIPGAISLITTGHLPEAGNLKINSLGLIGFWMLVIAHLCMEEMNYQWFRSER